MKQPKLKNETFIVDEGKRTIVYCVVCNGKEFYGKAKCADCDHFNIDKGVQLAKMRANLAMLDSQIKATSNTIYYFKESFISGMQMFSDVNLNMRLANQLMSQAYAKLNDIKNRRFKLRKRIEEAL